MPKTKSSAATNMTMICALNSEAINAEGNKHGEAIYTYIGSELVGKATKIDDLYFLTISCDNSGVARFETEDGQKLNVQINEQMVNDQMVNRNILYVPDSHYGSLTEPVLLVPDDANRVYKIIENDHVVIIRNNEKYDVTGTNHKLHFFLHISPKNVSFPKCVYLFQDKTIFCSIFAASFD